MRLGLARRLRRGDRGLSHGRDDRCGVRPSHVELRVRVGGGRARVTRVRSLELRLVAIPLVRPFRTSFGESTEKVCVIARVETEDALGWGECVSDVEPNFSEEWNDGAWNMIRDFLAPAMFAAGDVDVERLGSVFAFVRGNPMAKATLENAVLDAELRAQGRSLASYLGAVRDRVGCGVSVGIAPSTDVLLEQVGGYLAEGYLRIKLKIEPGTDVERVRAVREAYPEILLSVDANAAYRLTDVEVFRALDEFGLLMVEQPLHHEDLWEHSLLQREIRTDVCLDESIRSAADARAAIELGSCRIVNIKQGRVGGLLEAKRVHDVAAELGVPVWCGGMLETGIGRSTNLALAALPNFRLPGDTSATSRYFAEDLTEPLVLEADGTLPVPNGPGIGVDPDQARLEAATRRTERFEKE
ncbi:MAG: o-succinylbenzoate synthase [Actinobacteria bacterium]|nr:MAG: o-succinylbenzoate synthase [Actinomycetota bacterium]